MQHAAVAAVAMLSVQDVAANDDDSWLWQAAGPTAGMGKVRSGTRPPCSAVLPSHPWLALTAYVPVPVPVIKQMTLRAGANEAVRHRRPQHLAALLLRRSWRGRREQLDERRKCTQISFWGKLDSPLFDRLLVITVRWPPAVSQLDDGHRHQRFP